MTAYTETRKLMQDLERRGIVATFEQANTLRRAQLTLHRWAEAECGDSNDYASFGIERDEDTGLPYRTFHPHTGQSTRTRIADREAGALKRVARVCAELGIHFFHQTDPRGGSLIVGREPMTDSDYSSKGLYVQ